MTSTFGDERLNQIRAQLRTFTAERDWAKFHDPKNLAMAIVSEAGELAAELRWVSNSASDEFVKAVKVRERIEREIADVAIALILLCDRMETDLLGAVERKIAINAANYPVELVKGTSDRPTPSFP
jgi:NTP pyrophosphatase (non-canonical NTP hydrolase)